MSLKTKPLLLASSISLALMAAGANATDIGVVVESMERSQQNNAALKRQGRSPLRIEQPTYYIVQLEDAPIATYEGGVSGLAATHRSATGADRLQVNSIAAREYGAFLTSRQNDFVSQLRSEMPGVQVHQQFTTVLNAVVVKSKDDNLMSSLRAMPGVRAVYRNEMRYEQMDSSLDLINVPQVWDMIGGRANAGEGVRVAIIDGGIRPENPMFSGDGFTAPADLPNDDYCSTEDPTFCNDKLIVARFSQPTFTVNQNEYLSPLDYGGHGTHVAGTAVGNITDAQIGGSEFEISGVAPGAYLMVYKALFRPPTGAGSGSDVMLLEALEHAVNDGADVINNSWGGGPGGSPDSSVYASVFEAAEEAGVVVVTSAGNSGPNERSIGCPGCVEAGITVAASSTGRILSNFVNYGDSAYTATPGSGNFTITSRIEGQLVRAESAQTGNILGCNSYPSNSLNDRIVLVNRGTCTFTEKANNAAAAGAIGMIVVNNEAGTISMGMEGSTLPAVMISDTAGQAIRNNFSSGQSVTLTPFEALTQDSDIHRLANFSSRGPNGASRFLKPDITAPGVRTLSADSPDLVGDFGLKSGTSMAAPHVAGAAAILKQERPELNAFQMKSILMGSANNAVVQNHNNDNLANPFGQGAGVLDVEGAFGAMAALNTPSFVNNSCMLSCDFTRSVTNLGDSERTWNLSVNMHEGSAIVELDETSLTIAAGESADFVLSVDSRFMPEGWAFGYVTLTDSSSSAEQTFPIVISTSRASDSSILSTVVTSGEPSWGSRVRVETTMNSPVINELVSVRIDLPESLGINEGSIEVDAVNGTGALSIEADHLLWEGEFNMPAGDNAIVSTTAPFASLSDVPAANLQFEASVGCSDSDTICDEIRIPLTGIDSIGGLPFNGERYSNLTIWENGLIALGTSNVAETWVNRSIPSEELPNNILAPFWTDFVVGGPLGGDVYYAGVTVGSDTYLVIEWREVRLWREEPSVDDPSYTFSVWMRVGEDAEDDIIFNYTEIPSMPSSVTIGLEDFRGLAGVEYHFDGAGDSVTSGDALAASLVTAETSLFIGFDLPLDFVVNAEATTGYREVVTVDVLNIQTFPIFSDVVSSSFTAGGEDYMSFAPVLVEPRGNPRLQLASTSENGIVSISGATQNNIRYQPNEGFDGVDTVRYRFVDDTGAQSAEGTLTITVEPRRSSKPWYLGSFGIFIGLFMVLVGMRRFHRMTR
ncbi:MAG: S8 family serine peptidase [Idiomarina sp.]|nr:S8 family serine peptidase [Idiomarina sp.]